MSLKNLFGNKEEKASFACGTASGADDLYDVFTGSEYVCAQPTVLEGDNKMNETIKLIMERRSIRKYQQQQIGDDVLEQILYAASFSPNAGNRQTIQILVCQDSKLNEKLGKINRSAFHGRTSAKVNFVSEAQPSIADDPNIQSAFYDAPTVITLFSPKIFLYGQADCFTMANNIALAAYAFGIGSCILGRSEETFGSKLGIKLQADWGIQDTYEAKVHITLGFPQGEFPTASPRKYPNPIIVR